MVSRRFFAFACVILAVSIIFLWRWGWIPVRIGIGLGGCLRCAIRICFAVEQGLRIVGSYLWRRCCVESCSGRSVFLF